jgi:Cys-tRNA(Pro) deacylase
MLSTDELDRLGIPYTVRVHDQASSSAAEAARALGLPLASIVKTLIVIGRDRGALVVLVPGNQRLNLARMRQILLDKSLHLASHEQTLAVSGYPVGLVTPFSLTTSMPVYANGLITELSLAAISSGEPGSELLLQAPDLLRATAAILLPDDAFQA